MSNTGQKKKAGIAAKFFIILILTVAFSFLFTSYGIYSYSQFKSTNTFTEISDPLENPYMGWVKKPYQKYDEIGNNLIYVNLTWKEIEPVRGTFNFDTFESNINYNYWVSKGYKFIFNFCMDWPDANCIIDIPGWLASAINGEGTYYTTSSGSKGFSPNYSNTTLISEHDRFLNNFAARYNNSNTYLVNMASLGHWGEMHTCFITNTSAKGAYPKKDVETQYLDAYGKYFTKTYLSCRMPKDAVIKYNGTLHNHGFGDHYQTIDVFLEQLTNGATNYYTKEPQPAYPDYWNKGPHGAEFLNYPYTKYLTNSTISETISEAKSTHLTWLLAPPADVITSEIQANMDKLLRVIGYRLVMNKAEYTSTLNAGETLDVSMNWTNTGIAPCYFEWPMEIGLVNANGDLVYSSKSNINLKNWLPGGKQIDFSLDVPASVPDGTYKITVALLNPETGLPGVQFAFNAPNTNLRYQIGTVVFNRVSTTPKAASIALNGSALIDTASSSKMVRYTASVLDQFGKAFSDQALTWSIDVPYPGLTIDQSGNLTIPANAQPGTFVVRAVSKASLDVSAKLSVTLYNPSFDKYINIYGSTQVKKYSSSTAAKFTSVARNLGGSQISGENTTFSLVSALTGITMDSTGILTIPSSSATGTILVKTELDSNNKISAVYPVSIIDDRTPSSVKIYGSNTIAVSSTGAAKRYYAMVYSQYDSGMSDEKIVWSLASAVPGVSVDSNGLVTISSTCNALGFSIKASAADNSSVSTTLPVALTYSSDVADTLPASIQLSGKQSLTVGSSNVTEQYGAQVLNQKGTVLSGEKVAWSLESPVPGVTISTDGLATVQAGTSSKSFTVKAVSVSSSTVQATCPVAIVAAPIVNEAVYSINVFGDTTVKKMTGGTTTRYSYVVYDKNHNELGSEKVVWSIKGAPAGISIDSNGYMTLQPTATVTSYIVQAVSASNYTVSAAYTVNIIDDRTVTTLKIYGDSSMKKYAGAAISQFSAMIFNQYGSAMPDEKINWSIVDSPAGVSIDAAGKVTMQLSTAVTSFTIKAVSQTKPTVSNTFAVTIIDDRKVNSIVIYGLPSITKYSATSTLQFSAMVFNQYGSAMPEESINWKIDPAVAGVSVDSDGKVSVQPAVAATSFILRATSATNTSVTATKQIAIN